ALPRAGPQERRPLRRLQGGPPNRRGAAGRSGADGDPQRSPPPDEGGRLWCRLRLRPPHRGGGGRDRLPPRIAPGDALLRAEGGGVRGGAEGPAGEVPGPARRGQEEAVYLNSFRNTR